ncbi:hypothetical protein [Nocardiopsis sp. HUAS JQ3]|uniref:hypothetical protein n=1 Tax=Nocardiopsis sp. HUAS JQ3 TaxID=3061629 RepID=UPI0023A9E551|nr:hypothetical protein [Nocardiopsis sp. HUAS JQ3]WDZ90553.1 hypothetical protein PV789_27315 [Nocardiopsis sp. HUAS JQ3]
MGLADLFRPSEEELQRRAQRQAEAEEIARRTAQARADQERREAEAAQAQRERQVRITKADLEEIEGICSSALASASLDGGLRPRKHEMTELRLTRSGLIVRGVIHASMGSGFSSYLCYGDAQSAMRDRLVDLGFLVPKLFGRDGLVVTGWDPQYYEGSQLTPERIDVRIAELQEIRREVVAMEGEATME